MNRVGIVGASGFVGSHCVDRLSACGYTVTSVVAPRIRHNRRSLDEVLVRRRGVIEALSREFAGCEVVVNAAGCAEPSATTLSDELVGANAVLPAVAAAACEIAGVSRLIHISSAVVQGSQRRLDESSRVAPLTPYGISKALGESLIVSMSGVETVIYRPTSIQHESRRITQRLVAYAQSRYATVAGAGTAATPQILICDVADAVRVLSEATWVPPVALHPWAGLTTGGLLQLLGGKDPRQIPSFVARASLALSKRVRGGAAVAATRRLEMLWFGQQQDRCWLSTTGQLRPSAPEAWQELRDKVRLRLASVL